MRHTRLGLALLCVSALAVGASRARFGGNLQVVLAQLPLESDPLLADTPEQASLLSLTSAPLCRLDVHGNVTPVVAQDLHWTSPTQLSVKLRAGLTTASGAPLSARDVALALQRTAELATRSPYQGLLAPLRGQGRMLSGAAVSADTLELPLSYPFPDFLTALCHPALAPNVNTRWNRQGTGPYRVTQNPNLLAPVPTFPAGMPYPDRLQLTVADLRTAGRLFDLQRANVLLGGANPTTTEAPELYATYLLFQPGAVGEDFRTAVEASVNRAQLVETYVPRPAVAMPALLPPALGNFGAPPRLGAVGTLHPKPFTLLFDRTLESARRVAERLQLKLHDRGYQVTLQGLTRSELRTRWASRNYDAMLSSVLLPKAASNAFALLLALAHEDDVAAQELPSLGAAATAEARSQLLDTRLAALRASLPLIPLYAQGARVQVDANVQGLRVDGSGLAELDGLFLTPPGGT